MILILLLESQTYQPVRQARLFKGYAGVLPLARIQSSVDEELDSLVIYKFTKLGLGIKTVRLRQVLLKNLIYM